MKMNGARLPCARIVVKSSNPLMPGICRSAITHDVPFKRPDCKKCSADEYAWTVYPCDLRNLLVAARTDASSSTTEIIESSDKTGLPDAGAGASSGALDSFYETGNSNPSDDPSSLQTLDQEFNADLSQIPEPSSVLIFVAVALPALMCRQRSTTE